MHLQIQKKWIGDQGLGFLSFKEGMKKKWKEGLKSEGKNSKRPLYPHLKSLEKASYGHV